ncbi:MAG TPA: alpha/beta fold hydrolase [Polyangia bacterium]
MTALRVPGSGDKSPIFRPGGGPAVLCLHGFTGTPYEVAPLAHGLANAGFSVFAPMLAGHGENAAILAATRWQDWLASAEAAFAKLRAASGNGPVALAGFSMGALVALRLARLHPHSVSALVLMSTPLRLRDSQIALARAWSHLPGFLRRGRLATRRKRGGSDVTDDKVRAENPSLADMPLAGVVELIELAEVVRRDLTFIHTPALVAHGERDQTIALQTSFELAGSLASDVVERLWLPRSGHLVAVDVERAQLCETVVRFLNLHAKAREEASPSP